MTVQNNPNFSFVRRHQPSNSEDGCVGVLGSMALRGSQTCEPERSGSPVSTAVGTRLGSGTASHHAKTERIAITPFGWEAPSLGGQSRYPACPRPRQIASADGQRAPALAVVPIGAAPHHPITGFQSLPDGTTLNSSPPAASQRIRSSMHTAPGALRRTPGGPRRFCPAGGLFPSVLTPDGLEPAAVGRATSSGEHVVLVAPLA